ncbi:hypothetical protein ACFFRR_000586 [Megaselia abdita]
MSGRQGSSLNSRRVCNGLEISPLMIRFFFFRTVMHPYVKDAFNRMGELWKEAKLEAGLLKELLALQKRYITVIPRIIAELKKASLDEGSILTRKPSSNSIWEAATPSNQNHQLKQG